MLTAVLLAIFCANFIPSQQQCPASQPCIFPPTCKQVNFTSGPNEVPPYYDQLLSDVGDTGTVDSACTTAFSVGSNSSLLVRVVQFKDGSTIIERVIYSQVSGFPGAYIGQGKDNSSGCSTFVFNDYFLGELDPPCTKIYAFYRCYTYGDFVEKYSAQDMVFGYSKAESIPNCCYSKLEAFAGSRGLNAHTFVRLPNSKPARCIYSLDELAAAEGSGSGGDGSSGGSGTNCGGSGSNCGSSGGSGSSGGISGSSGSNCGGSGSSGGSGSNCGSSGSSGGNCGCDGGNGGNCGCDGGNGGNCGCDGGNGDSCGCDGSGTKDGSGPYTPGDSSGCWDKKTWWFT